MSKSFTPLLAAGTATAALGGKCLAMAGDMESLKLLPLAATALTGNPLGIAVALGSCGILAADLFRGWKDDKHAKHVDQTLAALFRDTKELRLRIPYAGVLIDECEQGLTDPASVSLKLDDPAYPAFALYKALKYDHRPVEEALNWIMERLTEAPARDGQAFAEQAKLTADLAHGQLKVLQANHEAIIALIEEKEATFRVSLATHLAGLRDGLQDLEGIRADLALLLEETARTKAIAGEIQTGVGELQGKVDILINREPTSPAIPHQLPPAANEFFGREAEVKALTARLREGKSSYVLGPAGMGKTALAAKVLEELFSAQPNDLARQLFPYGILFLDIYALRAEAEPVWSSLANSLAGPEFLKDRSAKERATEACRNRRCLIILEGAEDANGSEGRAALNELREVSCQDNRWLILTRDSSQTMSTETIRVTDSLEEDDAAQLFDSITAGAGIPTESRAALLDLLEGHPLALTWAASLLARGDEDSGYLVSDWQKNTLPPLRDPLEAEHTLKWLFQRSVRNFDAATRQVLQAAGLLARAPFPLAAITSAPGLGGARACLKRLVQLGFLRLTKGECEHWEFTHVLGYRFARVETGSDAVLRIHLGGWLCEQLMERLGAARHTSEILPLAVPLQHATALLQADAPSPILMWALAEPLIYQIADGLLARGRLDLARMAVLATDAWLTAIPAGVRNELAWQREKSVAANRLGELAVAAGNLKAAARHFGEGFAIHEKLAAADPSNTAWQLDLSSIHRKLGGIAVATGDLKAAACHFSQSLIISEALAAADPSNKEWQRDLSVSHSKLGTIAVATGNLGEAARRFGEALTLREKLAAADSSNEEWQRDLSVSHNNLGQVAIAIGDLKEAARRFGEVLKLREKLATADLANTDRQHDLAHSYNQLGNLAVATGDLKEAARHFGEGFAIHEKLAAADSRNTTWQRDLSISHNHLGELAVSYGDLKKAARHFSENLAIAENLAAADSTNTTWQSDLSVSYERLGELAVTSGDLKEAARRFSEGLALRERLAVADPGNMEWQRHLYINREKLGDLAIATGDLKEAARQFDASLAIAETLAAADPNNAEWQRDLSISHSKLGELAVATGDLNEAEHRFGAGLVIAERLAAADPNNARWQRDLSISHERLGSLAIATGDLKQAASRFNLSLALGKKLAVSDPGNARWQRDLVVTHSRLIHLAVKEEDIPRASLHVRAAHDILDGMIRRGLQLSPQDWDFLQRLKEATAALTAE